MTEEIRMDEFFGGLRFASPYLLMILFKKNWAGMIRDIHV